MLECIYIVKVSENEYMKAFIIEDELGLQTLYRAILQKVGYDVFTARDGEIALQMFEDGLVPDLIMLDIRMPHTNGLEVIEYLQNHPNIEDMHVVISTATDKFEMYTDMLPSVDFLLKPILAPQVLEIVERVHGLVSPKFPE